ncbi:MAG TPA: hypothetical protein VFD39_11880 [Trueperaceae bacterium]|nr:hypothetical protein [Trueperaceae bacterium]
MSISGPGRRGVGRRIAVVVTVLGAMLSVAVGLAGDDLFASAYGSLAQDLLRAFHAEQTQCHAAIDVPDVCFEISAAAASQLAEVLEAVVEQYRSAGLATGAWHSANGVWAVELRFGDGAFGGVEVFLTETGRGVVRGMLVLSKP